MRLRYPQPACEPHLPRTPDLSVPSVASVVMFEHAGTDTTATTGRLRLRFFRGKS
jgi:hypothetical protein